jgi:hypothetical protein
MQDRRERNGDAVEAARVAVEGVLAASWTSMPGIINTFDPARQTCSVQPSVRARVQGLRGAYEWVDLPLCLDCPVYFPAGGGVSLTFPVKPGDECLLVFADRCIDAWWQSGGVQNQADLRMHDLSDGFAFVGVASLPRVVPAISTAAAQLRNTSGATRVSVSPDGSIDVAAEVAVTVTAPTITAAATGVATISGATVNINGQLVINGLPYAAHTHTGVRQGTDTSGGLAP